MKFLCGPDTTGCVMHCILVFVWPTVHYYGLASNSRRKRNRNIMYLKMFTVSIVTYDAFQVIHVLIKGSGYDI